MKGAVYKRCACRVPDTRRKYAKGECPTLKKKDHGQWYFRYDAPVAPGEKRRQPEVGPYRTKKEAEDELSATLARIGGGAKVADRSVTVAGYLSTWLAGRKLRLKPSTYDSYEEAVRLYFRPGLGHLRLVDLRDHHLQDLVTAMTLVNNPVPDGLHESTGELLRRLVTTRADDERRVLPAGEKRRKKSTKPLSPARVEREFAVIRAALSDAVKSGKIYSNPFDGVQLPRVDHPKPLAWTPEREERFRGELAKRAAAAEEALGGRAITADHWREIWASPGLRPVPSMVWMPEHTGRFLDYLEETSERLAALFILTAFCGLRRDEVTGLTWAEIDLGQGAAYIRETGSGDGPKSEAGVRVIPLPAPVVDALRAWRKFQAADRLAWGADWPADGRVFTREDGLAVPGQWVSVRFEILAFRAGLPPIRFHDLRHGAASLLKASKVDTKIISAILGHSRTSFTDATYVLVFPEVAKAAAEAAVAIVPRAVRGAPK
jgi:integrase